jgi:hypothetical protein
MRYFKDAGYITAWTNDYCEYTGTVAYSNAYIEKSNVKYMDPEIIYDHNFLAHACNKNVLDSAE